MCNNWISDKYTNIFLHLNNIDKISYNLCDQSAYDGRKDIVKSENLWGERKNNSVAIIFLCVKIQEKITELRTKKFS